jgi:hypothetical protein
MPVPGLTEDSVRGTMPARVGGRLACGVALVAILLATVSAAAAPAESGHVSGATGRIFRGNGGETLPPFSVSGGSTLFWTNNGGIFQIFPAGCSQHGSVNSQASKGWTYMPHGRYTLQINAVGTWSINIVAGVVRPTRLSSGSLSYSGNGGMELPAFRIPRAEQLYWQAKGSIFQIFSAGYTGANVNSQAHKGSTYVSAGVEQLQINTTGAWVIAWRA